MVYCCQKKRTVKEILKEHDNLKSYLKNNTNVDATQMIRMGFIPYSLLQEFVELSNLQTFKTILQEYDNISMLLECA